MGEVPVVTGEPKNGLLKYSLLWIGIATCALIAAFVLHRDLKAIALAVEQLNECQVSEP
jgi:hypothetical protein